MTFFESPPGSWLLALARFVYGRVLYSVVVGLIVATCAYFLVPQAIRWCGYLLDPMTIVEPIQIPDTFLERGYTDVMLQHMLVDTISGLREKAQGVTPATDTEQVLTEFKLPDFTVPGTGFSVRPVIEFARALLKRDSSLYGSVIGTPERFTLMLTLRDPDGHILLLNGSSTPESTPHGKERNSNKQRAALKSEGNGEATALSNAFKQAAIAILKHQSPLLYAEYLTAVEQDRCLEGQFTCDFRPMHELFESLAAGGSAENTHAYEKNAAWALLALSKLETYEHHYDGTIRYARRIVEEGQQQWKWRGARAWAYYNWGVALNDMGCYRQATEVLNKAIDGKPDYAPAHNALARAYVALARSGSTVDDEAMPAGGYREAALDELKTAIKQSPGYQEAWVNRGDALRLPVSASEVYTMELHPGSLEQMDSEARDAYRIAVALNIDSAGRAYQRLTALHDDTYVNVSDRITKARRQCQTGMAPSLLESWGCSDAPVRPVALHQASLSQAAVSGASEQARVCSNPELALPGRARVPHSYGTGDRYVEAKESAAPSVKAEEKHPSGAIRRIATQRG
ncbi:tetratricopeptide repeat protein [Paraburkholderia sp. GAS334]|uniref:tetratricopeptide repeat protein n=1 Tax=Paraburkholderia sp. GAS334 TaxID=3035131 RepID=UPI003D1F7664